MAGYVLEQCVTNDEEMEAAEIHKSSTVFVTVAKTVLPYRMPEQSIVGIQMNRNLVVRSLPESTLALSRGRGVLSRVLPSYFGSAQNSERVREGENSGDPPYRCREACSHSFTTADRILSVFLPSNSEGQDND